MKDPGGVAAVIVIIVMAFIIAAQGGFPICGY